MSGKRYPEDFKIEAVRQVTDRGYAVTDVAQRLGVTTKSLYDWITKYGSNSERHQALTSQQEEIRKLKSELRRVTEERDILKEAAAFFAVESKKSTRS
jgi:transposase